MGPDVPRRALPVPLTSFVGRVAELQAVDALLAAHRLVCLTGAGGSGKTRLALEVSRRSQRAFDAGPYWVDLAVVSSPDAIVVDFMRAVGLNDAPGTDGVRAVLRRLGGAGRALVVVDNAEHVVDVAAEVVAEVLAGRENVHVLVTSREPLRVPGEVVWRVPSLATAPAGADAADLEGYDAARLFLDRVRQQRHTLTLGPQDCDAVVDICARLDGIPLALELAAARARTMSLDRIATGLADAIGLLTVGARTVLPRHQTLRASLMWSVDLLGETDRIVLRRLSVFRGQFSGDAAGAVAADGSRVRSDDVVDCLARLVDKSLVVFDDGTDRYRLLETMKQFAAAELDAADDHAATARRHAAWWASWCAGVANGAHGLAADQLTWALPDVAAAEDWCLDASRADLFEIERGLGWFRDGLGQWGRIEQMYQALLDVGVAERDPGWAAALAGLMWPATLLQRREWLSLLPGVLDLLEADPPAHRLARFASAALDMFAGDLTEMRALAADVIAAEDRAAYPPVVGALLSYAASHGHTEEAWTMHYHLSSAIRASGSPFNCNTARAGHYGTINLLTEQGRLREAAALVDATAEPADATMAFTTAAAAMTLACAMVDPDLVERIERWVDREVPPAIADVRTYVCALAAHSRGEVDLPGSLVAAELAHPPRLLTPAPSSGVRSAQTRVSFRLRRMVCLLVGSGRTELARRTVETAAAPIDDPRYPPLPRGGLLFARALVHAVDRCDSEALSDAHAALAVANLHGYALLGVDSLELLAWLRRDAAGGRFAARLLGAVATERERLGYLQRWITGVGDFDGFLDGAAARHPDEFAAGRAQSIADAAALAARSRGPRDRPSFGWASLTPTEAQVAQLAAAGATNPEIAAKLLMSRATVKTHLTRIYAKLGTENRTALAASFRDRRQRG